AYLTALLASARALRRMGRLDEALERARRVWDEARSRVLPRLVLDVGYWLGTFLLQSGRVTDAVDFGVITLELVLRVGDEARWLAEWARMQPRPQPRDCYVERRVEALVREPVSSELLEAAAREADELGFGLDALWTRLDVATVLAQSDRARAKDVLAEVAQVAGERGAQPIAEQAEKRLRALGVRTWRRGARASVLTEREREI